MTRLWSRSTVRTSGAVTVYLKCRACYHHPVENRTQPKTFIQWLRYIAMAAIALVLVWEMVRIYVL